MRREQPVHAADAGGLSAAGTLQDFKVADAMSAGVITCSAVRDLADVASIMGTNHVHCLVVPDLDEREGAARRWGVVSDGDLVSALATGDMEITAGRIAATDPVTVEAGESVERACRLMAEHGVSHLLVCAHGSSWPAGVISTLDVARVAGRLGS